MDVGLLSGLANALSLANIGFALIGCLLGTLVGILPGLGPASAMAILLPVALYLPADGAIIIMAGIYYGAMYGGSTTAILMNIPGEVASVITAQDGFAMTKQGRAGEAFDQLKANGVRDIAGHLQRNPDLVEHAKDVVRVTDVNLDAVSLFRTDNPADLIKPVRYIFAAAPGLAERVMVAHFEGRRNLIEETRIRAFDGSIIDVLFTVTYPVPPEQLDNTFITMQDIRERLNAEHQLRKLQADFSHAGRIATLGELATPAFPTLAQSKTPRSGS